MQASARLSSASASRKVIAGVSNATTRSCYRTSRGKAHAAPLPAQELPPKGQKRITVQERRVRIVEYVENYRASNDGKFPTVTSIRQQVGGSHYTVREVLQEMEYTAKLRPENLTDEPDPGNQQREIEDDIVNEAKTHARDDSAKHEESANTGLLGSLKSFAYGIRNLWKNM